MIINAPVIVGNRSQIAQRSVINHPISLNSSNLKRTTGIEFRKNIRSCCHLRNGISQNTLR